MQAGPRVLALAFLVLAAPFSAASEPVAPPSGVWTVFTTVEAVVDDGWAVVRVTADIANRGPDPEFPFRVSVPDDAFVTGLTIARDGEVHEARIERRDAARAEYDAQKAAQQTGGLVEKQRGSSVYAFLVNVAERTSVTATLSYERYVGETEGERRLHLEAPVAGFGRDLGARFLVTVREDDGVLSLDSTPAAPVSRDGRAWTLAYEVGPRPDDAPTVLDVAYVAAPTPEGGSLAIVRDGDDAFFAHRFRAPPDARDLPIDLVLVLDVSGSMTGLKMSQMQDAATQVVRALEDGDRLHLAFFSNDASSAWTGLRDVDADTRRDAAERVAEAFAGGGTNIEAGIRSGFASYDAVTALEAETRLPVLVFLTDGQPTVGATSRDALRALAREANERHAHVFALAFGADADWAVIRGLAEDGGGAALRVPEGAGAEVDLRRFMAALTTPVLRDVVVRYDGDVEAWMPSAPVLFAGSELLVLGRMDADLDALAGELTARAPDGERRYAFREDVRDAEGAAWLPRLVAWHEVRRVQDLVAAGEADVDAIEAATALALEYGFVTDFTSLVVSLEPRAAPQEGDVVLRDAADGSSGVASWEASPGASAPLSAPSASRPWSGASGAHGDLGASGEPGVEAGVPGVGVAAALVAFAAVAAARRRR